MAKTALRANEPRYIRLPRGGYLCPDSNLSRSALDLLTLPQEKNEFQSSGRQQRFSSRPVS